MKLRAIVVVTTAATLSLTAPTGLSAPAGDAQPLERAHAHNDYEHRRPLADAMSAGFTSVEADVYLVGTELLVAHDPHEVRPEVTLQSTYLEPLRQRARSRGGSSFRGYSGVFQLLVDVKSDPLATYLVLDRALQAYRDVLWRWEDGRPVRGAVQVVVSGNRLREYMQGQATRYAAYDGRAADLGTTSSSLVPLISDNFTGHFTWRGEGHMPAAERAKLRSWVRVAHARGQRLRLWATPDQGRQRERVWAELLAAGVDHINTDDLAGLRAWLLRNDPEERRRAA